jgi:DNA-directed RNA polymerase subunit F
MSSYIITFNNKDIHEFYQSNPNLNIETLNLILINLLKEMGTDLTKTISSTVIGEILNNVKDIKNNMTSLSDQLSLKLHEHNKSFLDTTKLIINASSSENADKIINLLNRNTDDFVNKINTIIPKTHQEQILILQKTIQDDLKTFVKSNSVSESDSLNKEFLTTIESKILSIQQPIFSFIHNNNEQISQKLTGLSDDKQSNNKTMRELDNYLNKFNISLIIWL